MREGTRFMSEGKRGRGEGDGREGGSQIKVPLSLSSGFLRDVIRHDFFFLSLARSLARIFEFGVSRL